MLTGNKGEWSEIYTLLKIVSEKNLFAGDLELKKIASLIFPIVKIIRDEPDGSIEFSYDDNIVIIRNGVEEFKISIIQFKNQAQSLLEKLKETTSTTFSIPEIEKFIKSYKSHSLRAKSTIKSDIRIIIHDERSAMNPELGFSIKSRLGGASTLLNAGKTTNFIYKINIKDLKEYDIERINNIASKNKIKDRLNEIALIGGNLEFEKTESSVFENNLVLIDSALPEIISEILLKYFTTTSSTIEALTNHLIKTNPLKFNNIDDHPYYSYKIKRFLTDIALGMMPSKVWTGDLDATGGFLVVREDGEVLCYHIYNRNEFENYLFKNTKLETPSSTRHGFGEIYEDKGIFYFRLNLQIRFL